MIPELRMQWPSAATSPSGLAHRLLQLATEIQFVEIGLDAGRSARDDTARDTVSSIRRALEDAMETDEADEQEEIATRLSALLHAIEDEGLSLSATVSQRIVESGAGVGRIDVLSIVVEQPALQDSTAAAALRGYA